MATLDLELHPVFAALHPDGTILLELAVGDAENLTKVTMPSSPYSCVLARVIVIPLDLDVLPEIAPQLAGEIDWFVSTVRDRLIARAVQK